MRPTDPPLQRSERSTPELVEELCLALRDVGVGTGFLPYWGPPPDIAAEVTRVREVSEELRRRGAEVSDRLNLLATETGWSMSILYEECLRFPEVRPWVRQRGDGIREALRCQACRRAEFPEGSFRLRLCDACLVKFDTALAKAKAKDHMLLYRTVTPEARCEHAGDDTVLGLYPWDPQSSEDFEAGYCRVCISHEQERRRAVEQGVGPDDRPPSAPARRSTP